MGAQHDAEPPELAHYGLRIDRAATHFATFGKLWNEYLERRPHTFATHVDSDGHGTLSLERLIPVPDELALVLGEYLYQLRAALDNCLYAVAVIDSGTSPPPGGDRLQWPICLTPSEWRNQRRRLDNLSPELVTALEAIQPYNAEYPEWNALRILHDLARLDRHRTMPVLALYSSLGRLKYDRKVISDIHAEPRVVEHGDVLVTFTYTGTDPLSSKHIDGDFEFDVELVGTTESVGPASTKPARPYGSLEKRLRMLHRMVNEYTAGLVSIAQHTQQQT